MMKQEKLFNRFIYNSSNPFELVRTEERAPDLDLALWQAAIALDVYEAINQTADLYRRDANFVVPLVAEALAFYCEENGLPQDHYKSAVIKYWHKGSFHKEKRQ